MDAISRGFAELVDRRDEIACLKYIGKYNTFYNSQYYNYSMNMLQRVCEVRLNKVAIALIDKNCDLTYQGEMGQTALIYAYNSGLQDVVTHIIDKSRDTVTRCIMMNDLSFYSSLSYSEMMYICAYNNKYSTTHIIKMIDRGYDIHYNNSDISLLTIAIQTNEQIVKKLIDIDVDYVEWFDTYCRKHNFKRQIYCNIRKYSHDRYDDYKGAVIAAMNDTSPTNALYQSFRNTYAVELVDIICDFILLRM
ncbi:MAG: hypothetical protein Faunusvirus11_3 [Faunusvirus sp.]|jgi:hypothetical protein|uniref:Ankyrin repeat protein n=1 Tax=Faunusvirus sp. TaxID=2487766 RepID=A0A3G4ZYH0_9VIRU|nr:MAG: hypothetical protein Faunusvirus11_3 [Faunusvirus sp.]